MGPDGEKPEGGDRTRATRRTLDWHVLRKVICDRYFNGHTLEHCPNCKDRIVCFGMIEDALKLVDGFNTKKAADKNRKHTKQQGVV